MENRMKFITMSVKAGSTTTYAQCSLFTTAELPFKLVCVITRSLENVRCPLADSLDSNFLGRVVGCACAN